MVSSSMAPQKNVVHSLPLLGSESFLHQQSDHIYHNGFFLDGATE
jgi:hypothetical protein